MAHVLSKQGWCGLPLHFTGDQPKKCIYPKTLQKELDADA